MIFMLFTMHKLEPNKHHKKKTLMMHIRFIYHFVTKTFCFSPEEHILKLIIIIIHILKLVCRSILIFQSDYSSGHHQQHSLKLMIDQYFNPHFPCQRANVATIRPLRKRLLSNVKNSESLILYLDFKCT